MHQYSSLLELKIVFNLLWGGGVVHSDICLLTAYQSKHLLTGAEWSENKQTNGLRTLRTDFLAWPWFVVLTFRALCNTGRVDGIHVQNNKHTIKDQWFEHSIVPNGLS